MSRISLKILSFAALMFFAQPVAAQNDWEDDPNWGKDMDERTENITLFSWLADATRARDYDEAAGYMRTLIENAPKSTGRIYTYGVTIYKAKIKSASTPQAKKMMTDSLMIIYDTWAQHLGDSPERGKEYILSQRAKDYIDAAPDDYANINKYFDEAAAVSGVNIDPNILTNYFNVFAEGYNNDTVEQDMLMNAYEKAMNLAEKAPVTTETEQAKSFIDGMFLRTGLANCENIEEMFKDRVAAEPENEDLLQSVIARLQRAKCSGDFFLSVAEKLYELRPTPSTAQALAALYSEKGDATKSMKYLNEAITGETDQIAKSKLCCDAAWMMIQNKNGRSAIDFARKAIAANPEDGMARLALAQGTWMIISASCTGFNNMAGSWVVHDMLNDARRYFADDLQRRKEIDQQIASHRSNFPTKEETFFRNLSDGASYNFNCGGITQNTTVRSRID